MRVGWDGVTADGYAVADIHVRSGDTVDLESPWVRVSYNGPHPTGLVRIYRDLNPGRQHRVWISTNADRPPNPTAAAHWTITPTARPR